MPHGPWAHNTLVKLAYVATCQGQAVVNVLHFEASDAFEPLILDDAFAQTAAQALAVDVNTNLAITWANAHTTDYTLQQITAQVLERPGLVSHALVATAVVIGANAVAAGVADDLTTSLVYKKKSLIAGKSHRGRIYLGPLHEGASAAGLRVAADPQVVAADGWATQLAARYTGVRVANTAWNLTVYSRPYDHLTYSIVQGHGAARHVVFPADYNGNSTNVTAIVPDPVLRTQRRREIGVGA